MHSLSVSAISECYVSGLNFLFHGFCCLSNFFLYSFYFLSNSLLYSFYFLGNFLFYCFCFLHNLLLWHLCLLYVLLDTIGSFFNMKNPNKHRSCCQTIMTLAL